MRLFVWVVDCCSECWCASSSYVCSLLRCSHLGRPSTELCYNLELLVCQVHGAKIPEQPLFQPELQSSLVGSMFTKITFLLRAPTTVPHVGLQTVGPGLMMCYSTYWHRLINVLVLILSPDALKGLNQTQVDKLQFTCWCTSSTSCWRY